jgi:AmmeMemoRadiSam system protein A
MTDRDRGKILLQLARGAIAEHFGMALPTVAKEGWLAEPGATFVTLTQNGSLRGCIGSLTAHRPLFDDVRANALAAAIRDPRFSPLQQAEFDHTAVEVSLLSALQAMQFTDEGSALAQLRPSVDGVVLEYQNHRGTFLPQVWEQLPTPEMFMSHLKRKAGLPGDFWADGIRLSRYTVEKWKEN